MTLIDIFKFFSALNGCMMPHRAKPERHDAARQNFKGDGALLFCWMECKIRDILYTGIMKLDTAKQTSGVQFIVK